MPLDAACLAAVREELSREITGMKIEKIQQPERDMIILTLRGAAKQTRRLLISAGTGDARAHLTEHVFDNPQAPPMFCMLLRKHLTGAKIINITQPPSERILEFIFQTSSAIGIESEKRLLLELFGRVPNIILIDSDGIVIDCLRRFGGEMNSKRLMLPGLIYHAPPPVENKMPVKTNIFGHEQKKSVSETLDEIYTRKAQNERIRNRSGSTLKTVKTSRDRLIRKIAAQKTELFESTKRDWLRQCGDIIMTNMHLIKKGQQVLVAEDFYSESGTVRKVELDPLKTPQQNAAKYYKAYNKAKNAEKHLTEQIESGERELQYIESVIEQLSRVENEQELDEIRNELITTGYIKNRAAKKSGIQKQKKTKEAESSPMSFMSSGGCRIFAGRNNTQNDRLTLKTALKSDIWLHTQKIPGAHVIISGAGESVDETTLREAAAIAAYYSAARSDGKVAVDHTLVRNVKKPPGGRPGMVTYTNFKTIIASPDEELVMRLRD